MANEHENEMAEPRRRLEVKLEMQGAVDKNCETVVGDSVLASAHVVDAACEAIGGDDIVAGARIVDLDGSINNEGREAIDKDDVR